MADLSTRYINGLPHRWIGHESSGEGEEEKVEKFTTRTKIACYVFAWMPNRL